MCFMIAKYSVYYSVECILVNYQYPTALKFFFLSIFLQSFIPKQDKEVEEQRGYEALGKESRMVLNVKLHAFYIYGV